MQLSEQKQQRTARFAAIRKTLSLNPAIQSTASRLEEKMERRLRRSVNQSLKDSDCINSALLNEE